MSIELHTLAHGTKIFVCFIHGVVNLLLNEIDIILLKDPIKCQNIINLEQGR